MSLGILVETSLANRENRSAVVNSLIDMLRRRNDRDEAFVLTYYNNLVFAQDLTNDPQQLEQALESIKPQKGAVRMTLWLLPPAIWRASPSIPIGFCW
jgi:hypothetical protein